MPRIVMPALKAFELPPAGSHLGTLYGVVELGTQRTEFEGRIDHKPQLRLQFELPDERMSTGRPFAIGRTYTLSSHERSALRQNVEAWPVTALYSGERAILSRSRSGNAA